MAAKRKVSVSRLILIIGLIIILIPCIILGVILLDAANESSVPINGNRFSNQFAVEIKDTDMNNVGMALKTMDNVENVTVILKTATLRVYVDYKDDLNEEEIAMVQEAVYLKLNEILPVEKYFTTNGSQGNYDLEIHFYNNMNLLGQDGFIYDVLVKTSSTPVEAYRIDRISEPKNEDIAKELLGLNDDLGTVEGDDTGEE